MDRIDYLEELIVGRIDRAKSGRRRSRRWSLGVRFSVILASALVTIILGARGYFSSAGVQVWFSVAAVILSALVTAMSSYEAVMDHHYLWLQRTRLHNRYSLLLDEIRFRRTGNLPIADNEVTAYFERAHAIKLEEQGRWMERRETTLTSPLPAKA